MNEWIHQFAPLLFLMFYKKLHFSVNFIPFLFAASTASVPMPMGPQENQSRMGTRLSAWDFGVTGGPTSICFQLISLIFLLPLACPRCQNSRNQKDSRFQDDIFIMSKFRLLKDFSHCWMSLGDMVAWWHASCCGCVCCSEDSFVLADLQDWAKALSGF